MAQTLGFLLAEEQHVGHVRHFTDRAGFLLLPILQKALFQIRSVVKIVFDGRLAAIGDDQNLLNACRHGFLHDILQDRFVHQGQHFFRDAFGVRQQPSSQAGCGDNCFPDFHVTPQMSYCVVPLF